MRKLVWFTVPFAAAALLCVYVLPLSAGLLLALLSFLIWVFLLIRKQKQADSEKQSRRKRVLIALLGLVAGFLYCSLYEQLRIEPILELDGTREEISAVLLETPKKTRYGCKADCQILLRGRSVRILLYLDEDGTELQAGDELQLTAELQRSDRTKQGEERRYDQARGVLLIAYQRSEPEISRAEKLRLRFLPALFSDRLNRLLSQSIPTDASGLIRALLTGDRTSLSYRQKSDFKMAGVSHMIAISGLHVSILVGFVLLLTGRRRWLSVLIGLPIVIFFVFSTGCSPSVVRAAVMQLLLLLAPLLKRENDAPTSLCAALLLLLLQNPYAIANISLQLSFTALTGILLCTGRFYQAMRSWKPVERLFRHEGRQKGRKLLLRIGKRLVQAVLAGVSATLGAMLFSAPLSVIYFGSFAVYTVLANLLILWAVGICFTGGIMTAAFALIFPALGSWIGWLVAWPVRYIQWAASLIAKFPFALLTTQSPYLFIWLITAYLAICLAFYTKKRLLPVCGILAGLLLTMLLTRLELTPQQFQITALDVGQGQCLCIRTGDLSVLYDCGGSDADEAGQHAAEFLLSAGVRRLDALILSHYDLDHIGGTSQLLYRIEVETLYLPKPEEGDPDCQALLELAEDAGIETFFVTEQKTISFDGGSIELLPSDREGNNGSLSLLFSKAEYDMLVTGDLDEAGEVLLLHKYALPEAELFVAGHHGAGESSSMALLMSIRPETVLISVGQNRYGHPSEQTLARFAAVGAAVYRTDLNGDITIAR